ncbi:MAG: prenyltransferase [Gammaproteobacteria bacterium]|nr:prenyltransferase [Rhodocyclaceae bacterium]MBU3909140.1 prenyltransferase [Gammaproteobacteria bacterium]MBU3988351.1 prenyltransferase [Gammaproteobacteria bacterium]MBU4005700.1 prenyltransferase [Gammaproteobacteria bacterium]MBU4020747.1 prenyltransferase [Gammaproteobacteria bacterium]
MPKPLEPTLEALSNPFLRYFAATRPAFLSVTFVGCLLGLATANFSGIQVGPALATVTLFFALMAHAGANVINDYYDALSGCDAANTERQFPFTGGSRFIQNGVLSLRATAIFGYALLAAVIPAGLWLTAVSAPGLILIGLAGLIVGWAYSAPPLKLQSRGLGEFAITAGWLLVVVGSDFVQRHGFSHVPVVAGLGFALLVANVLYINQFPDVKADAGAGKRTLVVKLGVARARWGYVAIAALAYGWPMLMVLLGELPETALIALLPALASLMAARQLWSGAGQPATLIPALKLTILAASAHGLLLAIILCLPWGHPV